MAGARRAGLVETDVPAWVHRVGGIAALLLAAGYLAIIPLFAAVGAPPAGAQARLEYHATSTTAWSAIVGLSVVTDLLFVPVATSLYMLLRRSNQPAMLMATAFTLLFVVLDLAVTQAAYASIITLGDEYAAVAGEQRAVLVAAAAYPSSVLSSPLQATYSILTLSIGILGTGLVMLRAGFGRAPALAGIATGAMGSASVIHTVVSGELSPLAIGTSLLTIAWLVLVGRNLVGRAATRRLARGPAGAGA